MSPLRRKATHARSAFASELVVRLWKTDGVIGSAMRTANDGRRERLSFDVDLYGAIPERRESEADADAKCGDRNGRQQLSDAVFHA